LNIPTRAPPEAAATEREVEMRKLALVGTAVLALAVAAPGWAQRAQKGLRNGSGPLIDTSQVVVVDGVVVEFVAGAGQGMPELVVEDADSATYTFVLGPYWYLAEQGFAAAPGDDVTVAAYACPLCETGLAVASVTNLTQDLTLVLRDATGVPLWVKRSAGRSVGGGSNGGGSGGGKGGGNGSMGGNRGGTAGENGGNGAGLQIREQDPLHIDLSRVASFTGTMVSLSGAPADGPGTLVLTLAEGDATFVLSPFWVLLQAEFAPESGVVLEVVAAPATIDDVEVWLALTITDPGIGLTIVLRDPATGLPVGSYGRRNGRS
jgi:hypothetical protein